MTVNILDLPLEVIEHILLFATPSAVAAFSQTCKIYFSLIYMTRDNHFWRSYFFCQGLYDDPRLRLKPNRPTTVHWEKLVQRWTAAANVLRRNTPIKDVATIRDLLELIDRSRPSPGASLNLIHLRKLLEESESIVVSLNDFIQDGTDVTSEQMQLVYRLKLFIGWQTVERTREARLAARCYVYDLRNYRKSNFYGPLLPDGSGRANWVHMYKVWEVIVNNAMDFVDDYQLLLPCNIYELQQGATINPNISKDERDWAGITGKWQVIVAFCDHRDLIGMSVKYTIYRNVLALILPKAFNNPLAVTQQPSPGVFEDEDFEEALRTLDFDFIVVGVLHDDNEDEWPDRPTLRFVGVMGTTHRITGTVYMGPDDQVRWSFVSVPLNALYL